MCKGQEPCTHAQEVYKISCAPVKVKIILFRVIKLYLYNFIKNLPALKSALNLFLFDYYLNFLFFEKRIFLSDQGFAIWYTRFGWHDLGVAI